MDDTMTLAGIVVAMPTEAAAIVAENGPGLTDLHNEWYYAARESGLDADDALDFAYACREIARARQGRDAR